MKHKRIAPDPLTVLCPERILDTEVNFKVFSLLLETQIRVDSSCGDQKRNYISMESN